MTDFHKLVDEHSRTRTRTRAHTTAGGVESLSQTGRHSLTHTRTHTCTHVRTTAGRVDRLSQTGRQMPDDSRPCREAGVGLAASAAGRHS